MTRMLSTADRIRGGIIGALVGDALGVPVEFSSRTERERDPVTGPRGFGTWHQPPGTWSDDGALLLCSVEALANAGNEAAAAALFVRWFRAGHWAAGGVVFDIGGATRAALMRIEEGVPAVAAGGARVADNGNGSLMRILPVALRFAPEGAAPLAARAMRWSALTHRHPRSQLACAAYVLFVQQLLAGLEAGAAWQAAMPAVRAALDPYPEEAGHFARILAPEFAQIDARAIRSGGYVIDTLEAGLWCVLQGGSYADIVLRAVNLGGDTDTTACVAGGLAGVLHGGDAIPLAWRQTLRESDAVEALVARFCT